MISSLILESSTVSAFVRFAVSSLEAYIEHIKTYDKEDKEYSKRGLALLVKYMYGEEAQKRVDFTKVGSLEMAKKHSYTKL